MMPHWLKGAGPDGRLQVSWEDGERAFCRGWRSGDDGSERAVLVVLPLAEHPTGSILDRLAREYELKDELDAAWAVRPLELVRHDGRMMLVLADAGGEPLDRMLGAPMEMGRFLPAAIGIANALGKIHQQGFVHKDIKPANILLNGAPGKVQLTGFGIASRLTRERQPPEPPETIAGTLAYMAPEQTGRMNRSIDSRSDLYSLGVTFYQMLTGDLPFAAVDPIEWVHCHLAKRPVAPIERIKQIPPAVSAIIVKLLEKTAEDRYQTAAGLERDLRRCQIGWGPERLIDDFLPGEHDTPDRLFIPEKLYGRGREVETLLASFGRIVAGGAPELILVSGYSGIGKSSVVNELQPVLIPPRGLFASGKFDQYKRDIPYSTLAQAFQTLIRQLLGKSEADLAPWRDEMRAALGPNAGLIVDLVPEVKLIIGETAMVPELPPQDAQRRFQMVLRQFIGVFARPEHPLALFLDDLQWLDPATLDLLEDLLSHSDLRNLLVIGAFRDNEITAAHPLMRRLEAIRATGAVQDIQLGPLTTEELGWLVADSLHCDVEQAAPLAASVHTKTGGNPFFVIRFLDVLADEGLLTFDHKRARWSWDLDAIHAKQYTDNVVELLAGKLARLPPDTQDALRQLACLGNVADAAMLSIVLEMPEERVHTALWEALRQQLIDRLDSAYKFVHDRVQEAAYMLVPEQSRAAAHLKIGRLLLAQIPPEKHEEAIFEIVSQLNRGATLIASQSEREQLAELNLAAGKRAKASTAYTSALAYLVAGVPLLPEDAWRRMYKLTFALEINRAECEFLTGAFAQAEERLIALSARAGNTVDRAMVACLSADLHAALGQNASAVAVGVDYLRHLGADWSRHFTEDDARREYEQICSQLQSRTTADLIQLPLMTDPESLATNDVLMKISAPAFFTEPNFYCIASCRTLRASLEQGNSDVVCSAYVGLGLIAGWRFGDYQAAFRFGEIGYQIIERLGKTRFKHRLYYNFGSHLMPCAKHVREARDLIRRAFEIANSNGDLIFAGYSCATLVENLLAGGAPLVEVQREAEHGLEFVRNTRFVYAIDLVAVQLGLIRTLRGSTPRFGCFDDEQFDEGLLEHRLVSNRDPAQCRYWICKLKARFLAGDYAIALAASEKAHRLLSASPSVLQMAECYFYGALAQAARCQSDAGEKTEIVEALRAHQQQLQVFAASCPENFENQAALVAAEIARIEGRDIDAMRLYEQAIRSARANDFIHNEAIAYEVAARFYLARDYDEIAGTYLRQARYAYHRWGAEGKVRQLDEQYPQFRQERSVARAADTIATRIEYLDLATVISVSQAVSGEMDLERLVDKLMRTAVQHAGAERGLLIGPRIDELHVEAEATAKGEDVAVRMRERSAHMSTALPESLVRYALRMRENVILDDAFSQNPFSTDPYIIRHSARSVLCIPLINSGKLIGVLYLENNLAPRVFTPDRVVVLKVLAAQAAISMENARLYRDLAEREARIRRLVEANIIGICTWDIKGGILEANEALLDMLGYDREELVGGRIRWTDLTPPDWQDRSTRWIEQHRHTGTLQPMEQEYFRKDGSRVPVLVGAATFEDGREQGVAFVLDLTERKRAQEEHEKFRSLESDLAHVNRVSIMGELAASLTHDIAQPIAAARNNARAGLNFLDRKPPELFEVREALACVVGDTDRARDLIDRLRDQIKKAPPRKDRFGLNEAIDNVVLLAQRVIAENGVSVRTDLAEGLFPVLGDRVQLQQIVMNLILNAVEAMSSVEITTRELSISTRQIDTSGVLVAVRDTGPGIDPEHLQRIFNAFYTTKSGGMGMGLSICQSIIDSHGGRLWAEPNAPRGAAFQFTLPNAEIS